MSNLIDLFLELVKIDSPTGEEGNVRLYIESFLRKRDIASSIDEYGNLFAKVPGEGNSLLLSAHMDTVEPGRGIKPHITKDGYIVSDGTTILGGDNKIGISVILDTVDKLHEVSHRPLELLFTVSEEVESGAAKFDYEKFTSSKGYCFDLSQPLGIIVTASPFYEHFEIEIIGQSAHAARPHLGKNVLPALQMILKKFSYGKIDKETFFNIGIVVAGDAINAVPGKAKLIGEIRSFTKESLEKMISFCKETCQEIMKKYPVTINSTWLLENPGYKHTSLEAVDFIAKTKQCIKTVGLNPSAQEIGGVSDANEFNAHGVLVLELSTGGENSHSREEKVHTESLEKLGELVLALVTSKEIG